MNKDKATNINVQIQYRFIEQLVKENKEKGEKAFQLANIKIELEQQIACLNEAAIVSESDPDGNIIFVNDKFCEISGYSREELIGENHRILKSGKQPDVFFTDMMSTISSGRVFKGELVNRKKGGKEFYWVDITIMPFKDLNGKIIKYVSIRFDITAQVEQKEALLRQANELVIAKELRQFIDTANTPIFGINQTGIINEWNHTAEQITGYKKDEVLGSNWIKLTPIDSEEGAKKIIKDALKGKQTANYEFTTISKDGQKVILLVNTTTRRDTAGKITGVLGVGQDITELVGYRKELEVKVNERTLKLNEALEKQKELNELKSKFVSTASHEFRTPLTAINFAAGSIKKYWVEMEPSMIENKLTIIENQVVHMTELLDDILIVGRADAGQMRNNPLPLNLGDFIDEIIEEVSISCKESHEILLIDAKELKSSLIFIDEKLGRNIFINLLSNAIKFSPDAKKIVVELSSEEKYTVISITDFGIGIPKTEFKSIFTHFNRGKNVDLIQGTGLGLSIVKEALEVMEGKIIVKSNVRKGSCFIVKIPKISNKYYV